MHWLEDFRAQHGDFSLLLAVIQHTKDKQIGKALRILIVHGYHTNIPPETLGAQATERYRSIWWAAYTLKCKMSVLMGVPLSICKN